MPFSIDIEALVASHNGGKKPSGLLVALLRRYLRIDFFNSLLDTEKTGRELLNHIIEKAGYNYSAEGLDIVPNDGRKYIFASNHPLGGIDGVIESSLIASHFPDCNFKVQVNDFLMQLSPLKDIFVPVNIIGSQSRNLPEMLDRMYGSDDQLLVFPAGLCSRKTGDVVRDNPWKKTFIQKGIPNGRWIVPVRFIGENSKRFYRVANLCKKLGIKFNFAMTLLPDEAYRGQGKHYRVIFGKPIPPCFFDSSRAPAQWAEWLREEVYKLN